MSRLWPDDVHQRNALGSQRLGHHVRGLLLLIDLAAVGDGRAVAEIDRPIGAIVEMQELLFVGRWLGWLILENAQKVGRLAETRARRCRGPQSLVEYRTLPAGCAA